VFRLFVVQEEDDAFGSIMPLVYSGINDMRFARINVGTRTTILVFNTRIGYSSHD